MNDAVLAPVNPFSTRFVKPGAASYLFPPGVSAAALVEQFNQQGCRGAIVGPHGTGKSTLLSVLDETFGSTGWRVVKFGLHEGERTLPCDWRRAVSVAQPRPLVVVDGYEQLGWFARWRLDLQCRRGGAGLLVTSHQPVRYPTLLETSGSEATFRNVVDHLLESADKARLPDEIIDHAWRTHRGNIREALFALYDAYEHQRRC